MIDKNTTHKTFRDSNPEMARIPYTLSKAVLTKIENG